MKKELYKVFPKEIQDLAQMGVYNLFESVNNNELIELIALSSDTAYHFKPDGSFISMSDVQKINFHNLKRLHIISIEEYGDMLKAVRAEI